MTSTALAEQAKHSWAAVASKAMPTSMATAMTAARRAPTASASMAPTARTAAPARYHSCAPTPAPPPTTGLSPDHHRWLRPPPGRSLRPAVPWLLPCHMSIQQHPTPATTDMPDSGPFQIPPAAKPPPRAGIVCATAVSTQLNLGEGRPRCTRAHEPRQVRFRSLGGDRAAHLRHQRMTGYCAGMIPLGRGGPS